VRMVASSAWQSALREYSAAAVPPELCWRRLRRVNRSQTPRRPRAIVARTARA
jgi:hypothetical protein